MVTNVSLVTWASAVKVKKVEVISFANPFPALARKQSLSAQLLAKEADVLANVAKDKELLLATPVVPMASVFLNKENIFLFEKCLML
jgi:hypothetical protein